MHIIWSCCTRNRRRRKTSSVSYTHLDVYKRQALASQQQADAVVQVTQGVDQISSVVQTNSATAEESAAASEELSGQANLLKELVGQFVLESDEETDQSTPAAYPVNNDSFDAFGSDKY